MDASYLSSPLHATRPLSSRLSSKRKVGQLGLKGLHPTSTRCGAKGKDAGDWCYGGRSVDEDMIVLRKRIHEMKISERKCEAPVEWMEWEKQYYQFYDSDVCEAVGLLQNLLMNTRPSLAIGMAALVATTVPTSMFIILFQLIEVAKAILSGS